MKKLLHILILALALTMLLRLRWLNSPPQLPIRLPSPL